MWISWAMANRDPSVFTEPNRIIMDRKGNRHFSFGLGVHRCIGSNVARTVFKSMLTAVLDRMPDYDCDPEGTVHYETIGVIQGMRHLPATFSPGPHLGAGLDETLQKLQRICDEQELARHSLARSPNARKPRSSTERAGSASRRKSPFHTGVLGAFTSARATSQPVGNPSTRCAMMLRWISEVPPAIVPEKLRA